MNVTLIEYTPQPEKIVAAAAKLCYSDSGCANIMEGLTEDKTKSFVKMLSEMGHESPVEHVSFTFGIEGVSRTLLAQITRHRHASFSVQSQRYVRKNNFVYITPPAVSDDDEINELYVRSMQASYNAYCDISDRLSEKYLSEFTAQGMSEKEARSRAEKKAIEDARFVLPNACETKMVLTMNARSLINFFRLRCCNRAQWEIRALAEEMYKLCYKAAPSLFCNAGPSCCQGACTEGKMSCKNAAETRLKYEKIKADIDGER
ncbi:MAG: FAD-dependent thymidylate synthase [Clostridium sp.]|nr:FAD-dependent thymidylate synthase [Clostridium sp.]MCM1546867.1 FAD-dependent thymidylate synthase [Ruminococcus sp.]